MFTKRTHSHHSVIFNEVLRAPLSTYKISYEFTSLFSEYALIGRVLIISFRCTEIEEVLLIILNFNSA